MRLSLVLPTLNERANIDPLTRALDTILTPAAPGFEVIVADGGSSDGTPQAVRELSARYPWLRLVEARKDAGLAGSVLEGFAAAQGDILGVMDADLQHPPSCLPAMLARIDSGAHLVVGSRYARGGNPGGLGPIRLAGSRAATFLARIALGPRAPRCLDPLSGYLLIRRDAFHPGRVNVRGFKLLLAILASHPNLIVAEEPIVFGPRRDGQSKMDASVTRDFAWQCARIAAASGALPTLAVVALGLLALAAALARALSMTP